MSFDKSKNFLKICVICFLLFIICFMIFKLFMFYIPFLIGFMISEFLEPAIKFLKNKTNLERKSSSIIVLILFFAICISFIFIGILFLVSESTAFLSGLNDYIDLIIEKLEDLSKLFQSFNVSKDIQSIVEGWGRDFIIDAGNLLKNYLTNFLKGITKIPNFLVYIVITILSTYFISSDKFYILDIMEYHFTKKWIGTIREKARNIKNNLFSYIKAELVMVLISFIIVLLGLNLFKILGLDVEYPLLMAVIIGFVDALPILGSGTVIIPWSIISFAYNKITLGALLLFLYLITLLIKQFLEPKIVSNKIGIHPIFTLIAMYTGFKFLGLLGLLAGPVILIILKNIFANAIDIGLANSMIDKL